MDVIKIAITEKQFFDKIPDGETRLFVTNCGYSITHSAPSPFFGNPENNYLLLYQHAGSLAIPEHGKESVVSGGTCLIFYPRETRKYRFLNDPLNERYFVYFQGDASYFLEQFGILRCGRVIHTGLMPDIIAHFRNIITDFEVTPYEKDIYRFTLLLNIFAEIGKKIGGSARQKATPPQRISRKSRNISPIPATARSIYGKYVLNFQFLRQRFQGSFINGTVLPPWNITMRKNTTKPQPC